MAKSPRLKAKNTAWRWFSKYIRARDCLKYMGTLETGRCVTCDEVKPASKLDASHFISREHEATMFDEYNVHTTCIHCNRFKQGRWPEYFEFMEKAYGIDTIRDLMDQRLIKIDLTEEDFRLIADKYRDLYKEICNG